MKNIYCTFMAAMVQASSSKKEKECFWFSSFNLIRSIRVCLFFHSVLWPSSVHFRTICSIPNLVKVYPKKKFTRQEL